MSSTAQQVFNKSTVQTARGNALAAGGTKVSDSTYKFPDGSELFVNAYGVTYVNNPTPVDLGRAP